MKLLIFTLLVLFSLSYAQEETCEPWRSFDFFRVEEPDPNNLGCTSATQTHVLYLPIIDTQFHADGNFPHTLTVQDDDHLLYECVVYSNQDPNIRFEMTIDFEPLDECDPDSEDRITDVLTCMPDTSCWRCSRNFQGKLVAVGGGLNPWEGAEFSLTKYESKVAWFGTGASLYNLDLGMGLWCLFTLDTPPTLFVPPQTTGIADVNVNLIPELLSDDTPPPTQAPIPPTNAPAPASNFPTNAPSNNAPTDCPYLDVAFLETDHVPQIIEADLVDGKVRIVITAPLVKNRTTEVLIGNSHDMDCMFASEGSPGPWMFEIVDCEERYTLFIEWELISDCNWIHEEDDEHFKFCTTIVHMPMDVVGHLRDHLLTRWTEHVFSLCIFLPKTVQVSDDITIHAPIEVIAGIDTQHIQVSVSQVSAEVGLTTSVQWPFYLELRDYGIPTNLGAAAIKEEGEDSLCPDEEGEACVQHFVLEIAPGQDVCELDGDYAWDFLVRCHESVSIQDCPLMGEQARIEAELDSASWCPEIVLEGELSGSLASYKDEALSIPRDAFFLDRTVYFKASFLATVDLASSEITDIRVIYGGNTITILSTSTVTGDGNDISLVVDNTGAAHSTFSFHTDEALFNLPSDAIEEIRIECDATVTYSGAKRSIEADSPETVRMSSSFSLEGGDYHDDNSSATISTPHFLFVAILALFLVFM